MAKNIRTLGALRADVWAHVHAPSRSSDHPLKDGPTPSCSSATYSEVRDEDEMSITASEGDLLASDPDDSLELPPPGDRAQEEADVEMSTMLFRAAASIGLQCTGPPLPQRSRLDTWYLGSERSSKPRPAPVPFFPEVHEELSKTWNAPLTARSNQKGSVALTSLDGGAARGYFEIPQVERAVAVHLCPQTAATWRARPRLPSRACKFSASLLSKAYTAAGQAACSLHAMAILQVHQAKALKELHEGKTDPTVMQELRTATVLALRVTKVTARALGRAMSTMVVQERHLWLYLAQMRDAEKVHFLDAPISQGGLFGDTVEDFSQQFSTVKKQTEAIRHILPRHDSAAVRPSRSRAASASQQPRPSSTPTIARQEKQRSRSPPRGSSPGKESVLLAIEPPSAGAMKQIKPLVPLCRFLGAWSQLPRLSGWLRKTIRLGHAIQFATRPPKFRGVLFTSVRGRDAPVLRAEVASLLVKGAIEPIPPAEMFSGFYSPYFIVPKKGGGLRPILDLRVLNRHLHKLPFRMVTQKLILTSVRRQDWFMAIDLKDAYFYVSILPRHRPFLPFAFEGRAYQYRVLPFGLSLSPRVFTKVVEAAVLPLREEGVRGPGAPAPRSVGTTGQLGKEQALPHAEHLLSRYGTRLRLHDSATDYRAGPVSVTLPEAFQAASGLPETISEAPGAHGILGGGGPPRVDAHATAPTLATESSSLESVAHRQQAYGHHAFLPAHPDPLVVYGLPTGGDPLGQVSRYVVVMTDASLQGWGAVCNGHAVSGRRTGPRLHWHINCLELWAVLLALKRLQPFVQGRHVLVRSDSTAAVAYINHQGGVRSRQLTRLARCLLLWSQQVISSLRAIHIPGDLIQTADRLSRQWSPRGEWRLHPHAVQLIWEQFGQAQVDLFASPDSTYCPLWYSLFDGPLGTDALAHSWPRDKRKYAFPTVSLIAQTLCKEGPPFSGEGHVLASQPRPLEPPCLAPGRDGEILSDLPLAVVETLTQARAPATRRLYAFKWRIFSSWCSSHGEDPQRCSIRYILSFLQKRLEKNLSPSTLKVYVAAIAAHHDPVAVVLEGLQRPPFEPLGEADISRLSIKTALLVALASFKRLGDLQAFSVSSGCLEFKPGDSHVILRPRPGYVPKVPTTPFRDQVVNLQALPTGEEDPTPSVLCPVHALRLYLDRTQSFRSSEQLFVCFGGQQKGRAVSKQRLTHWIVDAISLAYRSQDRPCPLGVKAHSTRGVASSWALAQGASLADICRAAGWATPNTFARFYNLCVEPVSARVLQGNRNPILSVRHNVEKLTESERLGYGYVAVGAPYDGNGAGNVFIFHGSPTGLNKAQVLGGKSHNVKLFGYSLAGNMDLDRNYYPDLAIGSLSDSVFVYRARSVISMEMTVTTTPRELNLTQMNCANTVCFEVKACFKFSVNPKNYNPTLKMAYTIRAESEREKLNLPSRIIFTQRSPNDPEYESTGTIEIEGQGKEECVTRRLKLQESIRDKLRGIPIEVSMALVNPSSRRRRQSGLPSLLPILDSTQESTTVTKGCSQVHHCRVQDKSKTRTSRRVKSESKEVRVQVKSVKSESKEVRVQVKTESN
ncbi:reverse transcriptase/ribonuclease H/putative methyltransferase [Triplophysa rosa]|uniref:ribonuclease H n=1 Tax=Triplophysa rosa TaxID=992332 RepID=A0A9W7WZK7_TRIRA|nr:reverse transcriptase/ribonuclease H/putative methyltransferase [Triplophysa rosa]